MALNVKGLFPLDHPEVVPRITRDTTLRTCSDEDLFDDSQHNRRDRAKDYPVIFDPKKKLDIISF